MAKSLTGEEVARQLIVCLSAELSIKSDLLIATMRDRASVNSVAVSTLSIVFPRLVDIGFSATLLIMLERNSILLSWMNSLKYESTCFQGVQR